jgi:predicted dehydrogenase
MVYSVAIIGTGADPDDRNRDGYAMAYRHAPGYRRLDECELIACADIVPENAEAFADHFGIERVYEDNTTLLREVDPDIVSVCVPPSAHAEVVRTCTKAGDLAAIHCEKPMATAWGDCKEMVDICDREDIQLTIDHQRRFARPVTEATRLLAEGTIGDLRRVEWSEVNLFDAGSHLFDLCDHFTDGATPEWVLAAVDPDPENEWFGTMNERQALAQWEYANGVQGFATTAEADTPTLIETYLRLVGDEGVIEIQPADGPPLRVRTDGDMEAPVPDVRDFADDVSALGDDPFADLTVGEVRHART